MNDNSLEGSDKSADVASGQSMGNLSSTEIGNSIDDGSVATLLMDQNLPDLTYNLTQALVKTSQSHQSGSDERRTHNGTSATESLQELDQADLAAILPEVTNGNSEVLNSATLPDGQILNQPKGQDEKDVSSEKQSCTSNKNSNSAIPHLPVKSSERDQELLSTEGKDHIAEVPPQRAIETCDLSEESTSIAGRVPPSFSTMSPRLTNSVRKSNRPIRHPLRGSEYLTLDSISSVGKRISSGVDATSFAALPKTCPTSVQGPVPGVRRRGRPKGAMNKKTIAMLNKTNSIRDSILEKLRAELFGQAGSSAMTNTTVELQDASSTSTSVLNGLPSLPPPMSSPISSLLTRTHHPQENSSLSNSDPSTLGNKCKSKRGRKRSFEEVSHKLGTVGIVTSAANQDLSKHMHGPLSVLEGLGGGSKSDFIPSSAKEPNGKQPSKPGRPKNSTKGTNLRSREQLEMAQRSSKTSTATQKTDSQKNKPDLTLLDSEASHPAGASLQPYPSQLAAGFNAIGNIGLVAPLFSLPPSSTFGSSATSPREASYPVPSSAGGRTNFSSADSVGERQASSFASVSVANDEALDLPSLEDLGNKRKRKKKKHHKHHKNRQEPEEVSHSLVPELDDLATHLEKIFITGPVSAKVMRVSCDSVLDLIFRSSPKRQLLHRKEVWRQRNYAATLNGGAVMAVPVRTSLGRGRPRKKQPIERKSVVVSKGSVSSEQCLPLKKRHTLLAAAQLEPPTPAADTEQNQKLPLNVKTRRGSGIASQRPRRQLEKHRPAAQKSSSFCS